MTDTSNRPTRRPGRIAHDLTATRLERPVPRVVPVTRHGDSLSAFTQPNPGGHVKIAFDQGDGGRVTMRTYTPRRIALDRREFVACEAGAMRRIRFHLRDDRQIAPERLQTRGYWRRGEADYPDHDDGED